MIGLGRIIARLRGAAKQTTPITIEATATDVTPKPKQKRRKLEPAIRPAHLPEPFVKSPRQHAKQLLERVIAAGVEGPLRPEELRDYYIDMIVDLYWLDHPWNVIAHEFTKLTTKKKKYAWVRDERTGRRHKLRVYPIPKTPHPHLRRVA